MQAVLQGETAELANGWSLKRSMVSGALRLELMNLGSLSRPQQAELVGNGVIQERIQWSNRYFVPTGKAGVEVLDTILKSKPVVDLVPKGAGDDGVVPFSARVVSATGRKGGLNVSQVERAIDGIRASARAGLAGNGVTIEVVPDNSVFGPAGQGQHFAGGYYPQSNRIVLVASALQSPEAARKTLTHELFGHFGLNLLAPEVKQRVLRGIERTRGGKAFADLWADIERHYPDRPALEQAEEVFARLAENTPSKLRQWWNQFLANYLVPTLRKAGLVSDRYTRAEMRTLADRIAQGIRGGASQRTFADGFRGQRVGGDAEPDTRLRDLVANFANAEGAPSAAEITEAVQQYRAVEREHAEALLAHAEVSKPLPAPNGQPSKLNREQWILTRTPNFKRWFGDWEGKARAAAIRELKPVPASDNPLTAAQAKSAYRAMDTAKLPNGKAVELVNSTWGKLQRHRDHDALFRVIPKLSELLRDSVLAYSETVLAGSNKPNIEGFHNYVAKARIGDRDYYVRFTMQEARIDRQQLHNAALSDVEIAEAGAGALHSDISKSAMPRGTSLDTRLAAWFEKINAADASKVVDTNGEPLVVYHGTVESFDRFDRNAESMFDYGDGRDSGGLFFGTEPEAVDYYTEGSRGLQPSVVPRKYRNLLPSLMSKFYAPGT